MNFAWCKGVNHWTHTRTVLRGTNIHIVIQRLVPPTDPAKWHLDWHRSTDKEITKWNDYWT